MTRTDLFATAPRHGNAAGPCAAPLVVGLGSSAGGLEVLEQLLSHVPENSGLAFILVQDQDRHGPGKLLERLGSRSRLAVRLAESGIPVEAEHLYVTAANAVLTVERGLLRVDRQTVTGPRGLVDACFRSLAEELGERAVGILLSGPGTDGTSGLRAIKEHGGWTLAQAPETGRHDGRVQNALAAGLVDLALPVEEMPARLVEYHQHLEGGLRQNAEALDAALTGSRDQICALLQARTGHDFRHYKDGTLLRRIRRRMQVRRAATAAEYVRMLQGDPGEAPLLLMDLLIGVTHFFRDADAFQALAEHAIPTILDDKPAGSQLRIWVPGCSSGEEAYSIAMLAREHLDARRDGRSVQVFATDIDTEMLSRARRGRYPERTAERLSTARRERFFVRDGAFYLAAPELREMCLFSEHNLLRDPPFSSLDLVSCRNVLIYLGTDLQRKLVPLFHYALRPGGFLFLGPSDSLPGHAELFCPKDARHRIFQRSQVAVRPPVEFPLSRRPAVHPPQFPPSAGAAPDTQPVVSQAFERMLLEDHVPASAVVNDQGEILCVAGRPSPLLRQPPGLLATNILDQARGSLRVELRTALLQAVKTHRRVVRLVFAEDADEQLRLVHLTVRPMPGVPANAQVYAVILEEMARPPPTEDAAGDPQPRDERPLLQHLEDELRATRASLQSVIEELASANQDLKSSNEELISTNEELQSANEELQTSREEIQDINDELRDHVERLATANSDLQNTFASAQVATLFLDPRLRIAKATPAAVALFKLLDSDVGRPMEDLAQRFLGHDLLADAREVLRTAAPVERELQARERQGWFIVRTLPYRKADGVMAGVVSTFVDITTLKEAKERLRESDERHRVLAETMLQGVVHQDAAGQIISMNPAAERILGKTREEFLGNTSVSVEHHTLREDGTPFPGMEHPSMVALRTGQPVREVTMGVFNPREQAYRWISIDAVPVFRQGETKPHEVYAVFADITARKAAEQALRESEQKYAAIHENASFAIALTRMPEGTTTSVNAAFLELFECTAAEVLGKTNVDLGFADAGSRAHVAATLRERGKVRDLECVRTTRSGAQRILSLNLDTVEIGGQPCCLTTAQDITERKLLERHAARVSRLYAVLSKVNEAILRTRSPGELYQQVCNIVATDGERPLVWMGLLEGRQVKPVAAAGPAVAYLEGLRIETDGTWGRGPSGTCIREGRTVVNDDFDTNPVTAPWREAALRHNLRSSASFPLRHQGAVVGALTLYGGAPGTFDPEQVSLLEALAANISYALDAMSREQALRDSETRYRALFENNMDAIFLTEPNGAVSAANPAACAMFGWTEEELCQVGREGVAPRGDSRLGPGLQEPSRTGKVQGELACVRKDGSTFPAEVHSVVYSGDRARSFVIMRDIGERKQAQVAAERHNTVLDGINRVLSAALTSSSEAELARACLEAAERLTQSPVGFIGRLNERGLEELAVSNPGWDACHLLDAHGQPRQRGDFPLRGLHGVVLRTGKGLFTNAPEHHPDRMGLPPGHPPLHSFLGVPLIREGRTVGMLAVGNREGGYTAVQQEILEALSPALVEAFLRKQAEESLRQANAQLRDADQRKNEFLAVLSHELRNPLAPIRNSLFVLDHARGGSHEAQHAKSVIDRQVNQLARLVDDLLDVTRINRGKIRIQCAPLDLGEVLRRAVEDHRSEFTVTGVELALHGPDKQLWVHADGARLAQAVGNLLQNAAKFTPAGGRVALRLEADQAAGTAVIRVKDSGVGIAPDVLARLFQPFTQADATLDRSRGGLGLGLALVRGLAELHGGTVEARSDGLGKGAEFILRLPLLQDASPPVADAAVSTPTGSPARRILIIEDNVDSGDSLKEVLGILGHAVEVARTGPAGLQLARSFKPDVVLCDIGLPDMDGYSVARAFRAEPQWQDLLLVALSGYALPEDLAKATGAGFNHHVAKPASLVEIERILAGTPGPSRK